MKEIPIVKPRLKTFSLLKDVHRMNRSGVFTSGSFISNFENRLGEITKAKHVLSVSSATTALEAAVATCSDFGDEVLVADFSFPASANAIAWLGRIPVLVDSNEESFDISIEDMKEKLSERTRAVIAVDPFGLPSKFEEIQNFCAANRLHFIEDAACALGSSLEGKSLGTFGDIGCLSFHPRKLVTSGEGGALLTSSNFHYERLKSIRSHGSHPKGMFFDFQEIGTNLRISEITAAIGLRNLKDLESEITNRKTIFEWYKELLSENRKITFPKIPANSQWNHQSLVLLAPTETYRNLIVQELRSYGVGATLGTYAAHAQPSYRKFGYFPGQLPNSFKFQSKTFTLPLFGSLRKKHVNQICSIVRKVLEN